MKPIARWVACSVLAVCVAACQRKPRSLAGPAPGPRASSSGSAQAVAAHAPVFVPDPEPPAGPLRYLAVGGGATPESTEVSLEQDLSLLERTLPGPGAVLFAGGPASRSVRELDPAARPDPLLLDLGELFNPRGGRTSRYREPAAGTARATLPNVEKWLGRAVATGTEPFLLYVASHGDQGASPRENVIVLWGGTALSATRLAELTESAKRPVRIVATSCYSGGFAELAFEHAEEQKGASRAPRCGLFAGPWDRQTSGCDANPDRRTQESYGIHFIHALAREDRAGRPLLPAEVDFDGNGAVSLLEAHTRARIASESLDVPTTTSERWLRSVEHGRAAYEPGFLPEEQAVVRALGQALALPDEGAATRRAAELGKRLDALEDALDEAQKVVDERTSVLSSRLLELWPVLDDPFHPEFAATLARDRDAIEAALTRSPEASLRLDAERRADALEDQLDGLSVEEARVLRLARAYETLHAAASLKRRGGEAYRQYSALLACERGAP